MGLKISYQHPHPMPLNHLQFQLKGIHITPFCRQDHSHIHTADTQIHTQKIKINNLKKKPNWEVQDVVSSVTMVDSHKDPGVCDIKPCDPSHRAEDVLSDSVRRMPLSFFFFLSFLFLTFKSKFNFLSIPQSLANEVICILKNREWLPFTACATDSQSHTLFQQKTRGEKKSDDQTGWNFIQIASRWT